MSISRRYEVALRRATNRHPWSSPDLREPWAFNLPMKYKLRSQFICFTIHVPEAIQKATKVAARAV
jgi:hypothetical protein